MASKDNLSGSPARKLGVAGKWSGRLAAALLFLFWGAFFAEHLGEWFLRADGKYPPPKVWLSQGLHLAMLAGLGMMLKWDKPGALVVAISTTAFFASVHCHSFPFVALLNLIPILCFAIHWLVPD